MSLVGAKGQPIDAFSTRTFTKSIAVFVDIAWGFIKDDVPAFVIPSSLFGILGALASGAAFSSGPALTQADMAVRVPLVFLFNMGNIFIWDLSNQRAPESVEEDRVNKPWRPIPAGKITSNQTRQAVLIALPLVMTFNYVLGIHVDGLLLLTLCWYYNDLKGSDEACRDVIIAICYTLCNKISLQIAIGTSNDITPQGYLWIGTIALVALSTMHTQDLKDQEGDRLRERATIPLTVGDGPARGILVLLLPLWSVFCGYYWGNGSYWVSVPLSLFLARRLWMQRTSKADSKSWKLWCLWHMTLFFLPLFA
jgi:4-hydroxybenzoate polyprenyltransferase